VKKCGLRCTSSHSLKRVPDHRTIADSGKTTAAPFARWCALLGQAHQRFDTFAAESIEAVFQAVLTAATQDGDEGPEAITDRSHGRCPLNQLVKVGTGRTWCEAKDDEPAKSPAPGMVPRPQAGS
jgi:hypothetical protein